MTTKLQNTYLLCSTYQCSYNFCNTCNVRYIEIILFNFRYENQVVALNCGQMLRECCRSEELAKILLNSSQFYKFFDYVEVSTFDIASDAFSTFKVSQSKTCGNVG